MPTTLIVNPTSGGGRARRMWPAILGRAVRAWGTVAVHWTRGPEDATTQTRSALRNGATRVVAVGGDGTVHEVVNGFFANDRLLRPQAVFAHVPCGTGADFRRSLGLPVGPAAVDRIAAAPVRRIDLIRAVVTGPDGPVVRRVANIASFGLGGAVVRRVNRLRSGGRVRGSLAYFLAILQSLLLDAPLRARCTVDGHNRGVCRLWNGALANGHTFGGGLRMAPTAVLDDGRLQFVRLQAVPRRRLIRHAVALYRGRHQALPFLTSIPARRVHLAPVGAPALLDLDGEPIGRLPATFSVCPKALRVQG